MNNSMGIAFHAIMNNSLKNSGNMPSRRIAFTAIAFLFFSALAPIAFSLSIDSKESMQQGDVLFFYGSCSPVEKLSISALNGERKTFSSQFQCSSDGNYSFEFRSSFTDPSGNWIVSVSSKEGTAKKKIFLARKKEAALFLVSFMSPSTSDVFRAETLELSVKITDVKAPVNDANAFFFGLDGEKVKMDFIGGGIYSASYEIPFNSGLKQWELMVLCEKSSPSGITGGSGTMNVKIVPASISVEFIKPSLNSFDLSSKIPVEVKAQYITGKHLEKPLIELHAGSRVFALKESSPSIYFTEFIPALEDKGSLLLEVTASDSAGNSGHAEKLIQTTGEEIFLLKENIVLVVILASLAVFSTLFFAKKIFVAVEKPRLLKKKQMLQEKIKELQKGYFSEGTVNAKDYKDSLAELNRRLSSLDGKIAGLEAIAAKAQQKPMAKINNP